MSDIRRFMYKRPRIGEDNTTATPGPSSGTQQYPVLQANASLESSSSNTTNYLDIGLYLDENTQIDDDLRFKLLTKPWQPRKEYNFKNDVEPNAKAFLYKWLSEYTWLTYSAKAKGPLCRICVLFGSPDHRSTEEHRPQQFINSPCRKYQRFHAGARTHQQSKWHCDALDSSNSFKEIRDSKIRELKNKAEEENRKKLPSIVSTILFCAKSLGGKVDGVSLFKDLLHFRIDSGYKSGAENLVPSDQIQNLIESCLNVLKSKIIEEVNHASVFSVLVGETTDINGKEQLSIGVRYLRCDRDGKNPIICEEFLGYVPIKELNAKSISETIIRFLHDCKFDLNKLVGQGYDGCDTMAGHMDDVKNIINTKYSVALLFHCASQVLNHVANDLNDVSEVKHTARTTKDIINFIKENTQHVWDLRTEISDISLFIYKTDWTKKYKNFRIFSTNFLTIVKSLEELSRNAPNPITKTKAHQLYTIATNPTYIVTLSVIAEYSAILEPICKQLQEEYLNINAIHDYINQLTNILADHRDDNAKEFDVIYEKVLEIFKELKVDFTRPRVAEQGYATNKENVKEFYRKTIFKPYLDSIITFLRNRFSSDHNMAYSLMQLHPKNMMKLDKSSFLTIAGDIQDFYGDLLQNFVAEATTWYDWSKTDAATDEGLDESVELADLVAVATEFYPAVRKAIEIALTLPATPDYERTSSTLRHVKRWNRSTMGHARKKWENGLCMLSVHMTRVEEDAQFIDKVIKKFEQPKSFTPFFTLN